MILKAMRDVADGTTKLCAYEDIVVRAWELFPQEFGLRGYDDKYPDSSDLHKPLYGPLKREGLVRVRNKKFGLTEPGLAIATTLVSPSHSDGSTERLRRDQIIEIDRLAKKSAVKLVAEGKADDLLDSDLYDFYGVTVRTKPADFAGRLATVDSAIDAGVAAKDSSIEQSHLAIAVATREALRKTQGGLIAERTAVPEKIKQSSKWEP